MSKKDGAQLIKQLEEQNPVVKKSEGKHIIINDDDIPQKDPTPEKIVGKKAHVRNVSDQPPRDPPLE